MAHAGWSWNLIPTLKMNYFADMSLINAEIFGESVLILATLVLFAYAIYLSIRKFHFHPAFFNRIANILFLGAFKKVVWIAAWAIITLVKYFQPFWNWISGMQMKRHAMAKQSLSQTFHLPVSIFGFTETPYPTPFFGGDGYTIPESGFKTWSIFPTFDCSNPSPRSSFPVIFHILIIGGNQ